VRAERVDLVLLDILMPEVDGLEILQELKALEPDLPVIMMTAVKTVRTTVAAMKLGASDYVTKPFQEDELLAAIRQALEQRARRAVAGLSGARHVRRRLSGGRAGLGELEYPRRSAAAGQVRRSGGPDRCDAPAG